MKSAILCVGSAVFLAYAFLLYCCVRVGSKAERLFQDMAGKQMQQVDKHAESIQR